MRLIEFAGKKVALWGLGREGWSTLRALRQVLPDIPLTIIDERPLTADSRAALANESPIEILDGPNAADELGRFDVVVKSPGISLYRPEVARAKADGTELTSATRIFFAEHSAVRAVCVTGTKGKSTTASLIAHFLRAANLRVELRGNIGRPLLDPYENEPEAWVIELSSYQTADLEIDPPVAVLTHLHPEHLDWHGDVDTYYRDKLRLFAHQERGVAVLDRSGLGFERFQELFRQPIFFAEPEGFHLEGPRDVGWLCRGGRKLVERGRIPLAGTHNHRNVCAALTAVEAFAALFDLDFEAKDVAEAVADFRALPHRLATLGEKDGVTWVDDSISTTPQAALAALEAFAGRPVVLLAGGFERGLDYGELLERLAAGAAAAVITLPPSGRRIAADLRAMAPGLDVAECEDLDSAVEAARRAVPPGGVVLLSPAAPSYGAFRNFEERGMAFARAAGFSSQDYSP